MSDPKHIWSYPMNPSPSRGLPFHMSHNGSREVFSYGSRETAVLRFVDDLKNKYTGFEGHSKPVTAVQCAPTGDKVVSGDESGYVYIWNAKHETLMVSWEFQGTMGPVHDAAFTPESDRAVIVGAFGGGNAGKGFNIGMKKTDKEVTGHASKVLSCDFNKKRPYKMYSGCEDLSTNIYQVPQYNIVKNLKTHKGFVNVVRASPDGKYLVSGSADKSILIYSLETEEVLHTIANAHEGSVYSLSWFEDSSKFASCSADKTVKIWSAEGEALSTLQIAAKPTVDDMQMGVCKVKDHLVSISLSGSLNIWKEASLAAPKVEAPDQVIFGHSVS